MTTTPTVAPKSYLDIKELGIKIQLTDDIKDLVYVYDSQFLAKYPDPQSVGLSSQALVSLSPACKATTNSGPLGLIGKTKNPNQGFGTLTVNNETVFKFGDYFVYYKTPQAACLDTTAFQELSSKQRGAFLQAFRTAQPD